VETKFYGLNPLDYGAWNKLKEFGNPDRTVSIPPITASKHSKCVQNTTCRHATLSSQYVISFCTLFTVVTASSEGRYVLLRSSVGNLA
jgi:hypothetical protein